MFILFSVWQSPENKLEKKAQKEQNETKLSETFLSSLAAFCSLARNSYFLVPKKMFHMPDGGKTGGVAGGSKEDSEEESVDSKEED